MCVRGREGSSKCVYVYVSVVRVCERESERGRAKGRDVRVGERERDVRVGGREKEKERVAFEEK